MVIEEIRRIVKDENIAVIGIGPALEMENESPSYRPKDFMAEVQSLICFGIPLPYGVYKTTNYNEEAVWRSQNLIYRRLDTIALRISNLLEENGEQAIPIYGCMPLGLNEKGTVVGILNQLRMAEITRIGVIGKNGLVIHSQYGSRLMLGAILTSATLPAMSYPESAEAGCPPDCQICSDVCPVNAIMTERKQVNIMRCLNYTAITPAMSKLKFLYLRLRNKKAAARYMNITSLDEHTFHICSKCVSHCPYGEKK